MKFALSSSRNDSTDFAALAERCRTLGYDGVELLHPTIPPIELRQIFDTAGLSIACIHTHARFTQNTSADTIAATEFRAALDSAHHLGCHLVKIPDPLPHTRQSIMTTVSAMAEFLRPLADVAGDRGTTLLVENGHTFSTARHLWMLLERLDHLAVGVSWNIDQTLAAGESPAVTIPTLNNRIRYVAMSTGVNTEALARLRGIGYTGWIAYNGPETNAATFLSATRVAASAK